MALQPRLTTLWMGTLCLPVALVLLLDVSLVNPSSTQMNRYSTGLTQSQNASTQVFWLLHLLNPLNTGGSSSSILSSMVQLISLCGLGSAIWLWSRRDRKVKAVDAQRTFLEDAAATDPGLLKKHSTIRSYTVPSTHLTYPRIRTFFKRHSQDSKLPRKPCPLPLLVFVHGLGGSAAQFNPILLSLSNLGPCLAIDLPGCGQSAFEPRDWKAYSTEALVQLLAVVVEEHRVAEENQQIILIGHSMGCSLAVLLASTTSPCASLLSQHVGGLVALCPQAEPPTEKQVKQLSFLTSIPPFCFDLLRRWDRRGGINSHSVIRMAGLDAEEQTKKLQLRFNKHSRSAPWQRMARGMCPDYSSLERRGGLPGKEAWGGLDIPVFLAAGAADTVTPSSNVIRILEFLGRDVSCLEHPSEKASLPIAAAPIHSNHADIVFSQRGHKDSGIDAKDLPELENEINEVKFPTTVANESSILIVEGPARDGDALSESSPTTPLEHSLGATTSPSPLPHPRRLVVKITILPKPAAHSLLFAPTTSRIIAGLLGTFFADHVDPRLSQSWQLKYLTTGGKWDVKNLEKWKGFKAVSEPIANTFRAMKTLREVDEDHTPKVVVQQWKGQISAVIDISHDTPVYDSKGLEQGGITYHKFPTVSKQPPTVDEVKAFIALVDSICVKKRQGLIGVHCHYGFNRTGFFLVSYMVERLGYKVEDAIEEFGAARPPGIRHSSFVDALHVRYASGLRRAPTL